MGRRRPLQKSFPKTPTKAPPITQEAEGVGNLDKDEEELDDEDIEDDDGLEDGFAAREEVENKDARRSTDNIAARARVALAWEPRGHPPPNVVRPDQPYDLAVRALAALRDDEPYRNPRLVPDDIEEPSVAGSSFDGRKVGTREAEDSPRTKVKTAPVVLFAGPGDHEGPSAGASAAGMKRAAADGWEAHEQRMAERHGMESDEEANFAAKPPQVSTALFWSTTTLEEANLEANPQVSTVLFGPTKALGQANDKANPPQVSTALFGLSAVFELTGSKTQGKTGQGVSAANFLPATTAGGKFQGKTGQSEEIRPCVFTDL